MFLPSYNLMKDFEKFLSRTNIIKKQVRFEVNNAVEFERILNSHYKDCDSSNPQAPGSIIVGISRGKMAEGTDLRDDYARLVIIVGIPQRSI